MHLLPRPRRLSPPTVVATVPPHPARRLRPARRTRLVRLGATALGALVIAGSITPAGADTGNVGGGRLSDQAVTATTLPRPAQKASKPVATTAPAVTKAVPAPASLPRTTVTLAAPTIAAPTLADLNAGGPMGPPSLSTRASTIAQFRTLSAGLVSYYAHDAGMTVDQYFAQHADTFADVLAANAGSGRAGASGGGSRLARAGERPGISDLASLDSTLAGQLGLSGQGSYQDMIDSLSGAVATPDGQAIMTAMDLARNLGSLDTLGSDGLLFGLFANRTLANFAGNFPADWASAAQLGLATPSVADSWAAARAAAAQGLDGDLSSTLLNPCQGAMIAAMASGATGGLGSSNPACGPCIVAGAYMHGALSGLVNPAANNPLQIDDGTLSLHEWDSLRGWQQDALLKANPGLRSQLQSSLGASTASNQAAAACASSSSGTANYLSSAMPGLIGALGG